jgi:Tfp pilus assembly protein PilF
MWKRRFVAFLMAFVLTLGASAMWSAGTVERDGDPDVNLIEDSGAEAGGVSEKKKGGNKVARVFAAPFKAFGRLFKGKGDNKLQRMTEKDSAKFESVAVARVENNRELSRQITEPGRSAKEHLAAGRSFLIQGRLNDAIAELSTATSLDGKLAEAHNLLGVAYDRKGLIDRAKDSYERAVKAEPNDAQILNNLGFSFYKNGNYRAAIDRLKRALKLAPNDERVLNNLGLALCRMGKFEEANEHFTRARGELTGSLNTEKMLDRLGREEEAVKYYEKARRLDPDNSFALRRLSDLYHRIGKPEKAQAARLALALPGNPPLALNGR